MIESLGAIFSWLIIVMGIALVVAVAGLRLIWSQITSLQVPAEAGFFATMHYIPLPMVILLDLLDFSLDIFAAPVSWVVLERLGLPALRNKAAIEALIPFTQPIPVFTVAWIAARLLKLDDNLIKQIPRS